VKRRITLGILFYSIKKNQIVRYQTLLDIDKDIYVSGIVKIRNNSFQFRNKKYVKEIVQLIN